jgi:hypothetical protein
VAGLFFIAVFAALLDVTSFRWGADSRDVDLDGRHAGPLGTR